MRASFVLALVLAAAGCRETPSDRPLTEADLDAVRGVIRSYAESWKSMDTTGILDLFTEDATIYPSGLRPRTGRDALKAFWFPDDGSSTTVDSYDIEILTDGGAGDVAYTIERTQLAFSYSLGDLTLSRKIVAHATTIYQRQPDGSWKIRHRMWSDLRAEHEGSLQEQE